MNTDRSITLEKTIHIKACALILMMFHHLFGCGTFLTLEENNWISLFPGLLNTLSVAGKICISMFLFCTGYGLYHSYIVKPEKKLKYIFSKILSIMIPYWLIMIFTMIYLAAKGKLQLRFLFINIFALLHNDEILYVSFSWFIKLYILTVLLFPLIKLIENKTSDHIILDIGLYVVLPFSLSMILIYCGYSNDKDFLGIGYYILNTIQFVFYWFPFVAVGLLFAKYKIYEKIRGFTDRLPKPITIIFSLIGMTAVLYIRSIYMNMISDTVYCPVFIVCFLLLIDNLKRKSKYVMPYIGKNTLLYFLISGLFFLNTSELQYIIYFPKYALLIFIWTMLILTPAVEICRRLSGKTESLILSR